MSYSKPSNDSANYFFLIMPRYFLFWVCIALIPVAWFFKVWWLLVIVVCLSCLGIYNINQKRHAI